MLKDYTSLCMPLLAIQIQGIVMSISLCESWTYAHFFALLYLYYSFFVLVRLNLKKSIIRCNSWLVKVAENFLP